MSASAIPSRLVSIFCVGLAAALVSAIAGCSTPSREEVDPSAAGMPTERLIGTVEVVREEAGFILIKVPVGFGLSVGTPLEVRPAAGGAPIALSVSPERGRTLVVADFFGGVPQIGDPVYQRLGSATSPDAPYPADAPPDGLPPELIDSY